MSEPSCPCCGTELPKYNTDGHNPECVWYEDEMYRLAQEWLTGPEYEIHPCKKIREEDTGLRPMSLRADWKKRYNLIVKFLLDQVYCLKNNLEEERREGN